MTDPSIDTAERKIQRRRPKRKNKAERYAEARAAFLAGPAVALQWEQRTAKEIEGLADIYARFVAEKARPRAKDRAIAKALARRRLRGSGGGYK